MAAVAEERHARRWVHELRMHQALRDLNHASAERHARELLDLGNDRPEVRDPLVAAYGLSRSGAYRVINTALSQRGRPLGA